MSNDYRKIFCPSCEQNIEYPSKSDVTEFVCPSCSQPIEVEREPYERSKPVAGHKMFIYAAAVIATIIVGAVGAYWIEREESPAPRMSELSPSKRWQYILFDPHDFSVDAYYMEIETHPLVKASCFSVKDALDRLGQSGFELAYFSPNLAILKRPDENHPVPAILFKKRLTTTR